MRRILGAAFAAALVSVPAGLAAPSINHRTVPHPSAANPAKHGVKPCPKPRHRGVAYVIRGFVMNDVPAGATSFTLDITSVNAHAKRALLGAAARGGGSYDGTITVTIDRCTFITKNKSPRKRGPAALRALDRVIIGWKDARGLSFDKLGAADRIVDRGRAHTTP